MSGDRVEGEKLEEAGSEEVALMKTKVEEEGHRPLKDGGKG